MTITTIKYIRALETELVIQTERAEAREKNRRPDFTATDLLNASKRRESACQNYKHQLEYFQLMGVDEWEAS